MRNISFWSALLLVAIFGGASVAVGATIAWIQSGNNLVFTGGKVGIGTTSPGAILDVYGKADATKYKNSGMLQIGGTLRLDNNEIITNENTPLYLQGDNNGDLIVDGNTFAVDSSANRVGIGTKYPRTAIDIYGYKDATKYKNSGMLQIGGTLRLDNNEIITNANTPLYLQSDNNGDLRVDNTTFMVDASADRVGIRTTVPNATLDVNGNIYVDTDADVNGDLTVRGSIRSNPNGDVIIRLGN